MRFTPKKKAPYRINPMTSKVLFLFDETSMIDKVRPFVSGRHIFLCPITTNQRHIEFVLTKLNEMGYSDIVQVPFVKYFHENAFKFREKFIKFIAGFADESHLKTYFKYPFRDFSIWWLSLLAEKNTLKSDAYHSLIKLLTILELQEKNDFDEIWLDLADKELSHSIIDNIRRRFSKTIYSDFKNYKREGIFREALPFFITGCYYIFRYFYRSLKAKWTMSGVNRRHIFSEAKYVIVTYFPLFDKEALSRYRFYNRFYWPLQRAIEMKYQRGIVWLAMSVRIEDFDYNKSMLLAREINKLGQSLFLCEEWFGIKDILPALVNFIFFSVKSLIRTSDISSNFYFSEGINIWNIFKRDWFLSFSGPVLSEGLIYYRSFFNLSKRIVSPINVLYYAEFHAWEKALNIALGYKAMKIGIQHTIVPLLLLMYFNDRVELQGDDYMNNMPKPDYLACVGNIPFEVLRSHGWPQERIFVWGALRFQHFKKYLENNVSWDDKENQVIVALSISPKESKELLLYINSAIRPPTNYKVIIKSHPSNNAVHLIDSLRLKLDEAIFSITDSPLTEIVPKAKAMVVSESSVCLDAIACQCPVIVPRLISVVDMNALSGISDLAIYTNTTDQLREAIENIMMAGTSPLDYELCKSFILSYCKFWDSTLEPLEILEEKIGTSTK